MATVVKDNWQILITIALIILSWGRMETRLTSLERGLDKVEERVYELKGK